MPSFLKSSAAAEMKEDKRHLAFSYVKVKKLGVVKVMLVQSFLLLRHIVSHYKQRKLFQSTFLALVTSGNFTDFLQGFFEFLSLRVGVGLVHAFSFFSSATLTLHDIFFHTVHCTLKLKKCQNGIKQIIKIQR